VVLILAFDCSSPAGTVAVLDGPRVLARQSLDPTKRSAKTLAPAVESVLSQVGKLPRELQLIATTVGPGSFTGLRVGVTMAKTLAYALKCDVVGLNTLDVIATQAALPDLKLSSGIIHAVLDAQRKELFVGRYQWSEGHPLPPSRLDDGQTILPAEEWLRTLQPGDVVTGAGLARWKARLPADVIVAPAEVFEPDASTIGQLAFHQYQFGRHDNFWTLSPLYIRPSYAEEKK
jgi:tRNA threonylcarbamoyladenosine biosynthesis protein TsaB